MPSIENQPDTPTNPIEDLESKPISQISANDIQAAINAVEVGSSTAHMDTEVILGIASHASYLDPSNADLGEMVERADKIWRREAVEQGLQFEARLNDIRQARIDMINTGTRCNEHVIEANKHGVETLPDDCPIRLGETSVTCEIECSKFVESMRKLVKLDSSYAIPKVER